MASHPFSGLPVGARFLLNGERYIKLEHDLREGMLHCTNAVSDDGRWTLVAEDEAVDLLAGEPPGQPSSNA